MNSIDNKIEVTDFTQYPSFYKQGGASTGFNFETKEMWKPNGIKIQINDMHDNYLRKLFQTEIETRINGEEIFYVYDFIKKYPKFEEIIGEHPILRKYKNWHTAQKYYRENRLWREFPGFVKVIELESIRISQPTEWTYNIFKNDPPTPDKGGPSSAARYATRIDGKIVWSDFVSSGDYEEEGNVALDGGLESAVNMVMNFTEGREALAKALKSRREYRNAIRRIARRNLANQPA